MKIAILQLAQEDLAEKTAVTQEPLQHVRNEMIKCIADRHLQILSLSSATRMMTMIAHLKNFP